MNPIEKIIDEIIKKYTIANLIISIFISGLIMRFFGSQISIFFKTDENFLSYILILLIAILLNWVQQNLSLIFLYFTSLKKIDGIPRIEKWEHQGSLKIIGDSLEITASNSGCLIRDYLYKNFIMSFNLKIPNGGRAGIVFRAQNLENYLMLQIELADTSAGTIVYDIIPHIRISGDFETFKIDNRESYSNPKLEYDAEKGLLINLEVKDSEAKVTIESNNKVEEFRWNIPTHAEPNIIQRPEKMMDSLGEKFTSKIWFRDKYGKIGFRAVSLEKAIISNLKVKKI